MTVRLHEQGHFTWPQWTEALSATIAAALEKLVVAKGLGSQDEFGRLKDDWTEATVSTPHGASPSSSSAPGQAERLSEVARSEGRTRPSVSV